MEMTVRIQEGFRKAYCIVEDADSKFLRYRNHSVAMDVFDSIQKEPHLLPVLARESMEVGRDWFGFDAVVTRPGRRVTNGWEFTLDGNNDHVQAIGFEHEHDARWWLTSRFGIKT
ncbi:hypothetical protein [Agrobacterium sp.]|uniref:hypothetical protein n=1 Tax=Agrobacterium sp. TaxID=361 RepID=UPI00289B1CD6|nr:hypothetical protein [Agrobacterium sp.]